MKEIKVRIWNDNKMDYECENLSVWHGILVPESDGIIMQFTGLKDCEGREIYEDDIIQILEQDPVVVSDIRCLYEYFTGGSADECKIIGNIYENSE